MFLKDEDRHFCRSYVCLAALLLSVRLTLTSTQSRHRDVLHEWSPDESEDDDVGVDSRYYIISAEAVTSSDDNDCSGRYENTDSQHRDYEGTKQQAPPGRSRRRRCRERLP